MSSPSQSDLVTYEYHLRVVRALVAECNCYRELCEMVDAHYSGSLDHQPAYVRAIRSALDQKGSDDRA